MSSSAINAQLFQAKIGSIQNQADSTSVYSNGQWSFKNSTALTSVTITDAGNVGIGTASPAAKLHVATPASGTGVRFRYASGTNNPLLDISTTEATNVVSINSSSSTGSDVLSFGTASAERMRIDASGNLLVGATSALGKITTTGTGQNTANSPFSSTATLTGAGGVYAATFYNGATFSGSITVNGATTAFNTGPSDYRLKEQVQALSGGLDKIKALHPVSFVWKESQKQDIGFIAHEIQTIVSEAVVGEKDAVDAEGNPVYQSIFPAPAQMIANLVAAIQELSAKNDALEARLAALEAK